MRTVRGTMQVVWAESSTAVLLHGQNAGLHRPQIAAPLSRQIYTAVTLTSVAITFLGS